jgi:hypothetical protein
MMYVGVTTMTLHNRMLAHKGDGPMSALLKAEGLEGFEYSVVQSFSSKEQALAAEAALIHQLGCHEPSGFNRQVRGGRYPGRGGPKLGNMNSRRRAVAQLTKDGEVVRIWPTVLDAANTLGIARNTIHRCFRHPTYSAGGFRWKAASAV